MCYCYLLTRKCELKCNSKISSRLTRLFQCTSIHTKMISRVNQMSDYKSTLVIDLVNLETISPYKADGRRDYPIWQLIR